MARFAKPLQGPFSLVAKHPQKHKNRPEIGRFSHFNPSAEMHPFSLFSASKAPEKWLCDAICRKKQLFPTSRSGFLILHECLHFHQTLIFLILQFGLFAPLQFCCHIFVRRICPTISHRNIRRIGKFCAKRDQFIIRWRTCSCN